MVSRSKTEIAEMLRRAKNKWETIAAMQCPICGLFLDKDGRCRRIRGDEHL